MELCITFKKKHFIIRFIYFCLKNIKHELITTKYGKN